MNEINGYWANGGIHYCMNGHKTVYQMFSGGAEFYCPECDYKGLYPHADKPIIHAHLLKTEEGRKKLKKIMRTELDKRIRERDLKKER